MTTSVSKTRALVECALMIAIGAVLAQIKIFAMPYGGSVTLLSMLPFILVSFRHGLAWGLLTGFANSLLQMFTGFYPPPANTIVALIGVVLLDYVLAFMVLGTACVFAKPFKKRGLGITMDSIVDEKRKRFVNLVIPLDILVGVLAVCFLRFVCSWISGAWLWGEYQSSYDWAIGLNVWVYSLIYNGSYMLPEAVFTAVGAIALYNAAPKLFQA